MVVFLLESHGVQQFEDSVSGLMGPQALVDPERFGDDLPNRHAAVERGGRRLVDHLDLGPLALHFLARQMGDVVSLKQNLPLGWFQQAHHAFANCGFSRAGFPNQPQGFARLKGEAHIVNGLDLADLTAQQSLPGSKVHLQVADLKQWGRGAHVASG